MSVVDFDGGNPKWALVGARLCEYAYDRTRVGDFAGVASLLVGEPLDVRFRDLENGVPAAMLAVGPYGSAVAVSGITAISQGLAIKDSYETTLLSPLYGYFPKWFHDGASQLMRTLNLASRVASKDVFLFGHSGGGGIATVLATFLKSACRPGVVSCTTYGSPRVVHNRAVSSLDGIAFDRWQNLGDNVPRLPPRVSDLTDLTFLNSIVQLPLWYRWGHTPGGLALDPSGIRTLSATPPPGPLLSFTTFPLEYISSGTAFGPPHGIDEYAKRLALAIPNKVIGLQLVKREPTGNLTLPTLFEQLQPSGPLDAIQYQSAGLEIPVSSSQVTDIIDRRSLFIESPIKRCCSGRC